MSGTNPSPGLQVLTTLSHKGRGLKKDEVPLTETLKGRGLKKDEVPLIETLKGRGLKRDSALTTSQPSTLVGEGALQAKRSKAGEGAKLKFAKHLRSNMTDVEKKLWQQLRAKRFEQFKFRRQVPIGKYIADFVCHEKKLIIELDGSQHEGSTHDIQRDAWLKSQDFRILRFWNININQALDGTMLAILDALK